MKLTSSSLKCGKHSSSSDSNSELFNRPKMTALDGPTMSSDAAEAGWASCHPATAAWASSIGPTLDSFTISPDRRQRNRFPLQIGLQHVNMTQPISPPPLRSGDYVISVIHLFLNQVEASVTCPQGWTGDTTLYLPDWSFCFFASLHFCLQNRRVLLCQFTRAVKFKAEVADIIKKVLRFAITQPFVSQRFQRVSLSVSHLPSSNSLIYNIYNVAASRLKCLLMYLSIIIMSVTIHFQ